MLESLAKISHTITTIAVILAIIFAVFGLRRKYLRPSKYTKTARSESAHGVLFGTNKLRQIVYSPTGQEGHIGVFGSSGTGKTSAILIPTINAVTSGQNPANVFCIDIAGDIEPNTHVQNKIVYDPNNTKSNVSYNPFGYIDYLNDYDDQTDALCQLALILLPYQENESGGSKYFLDGGRDILKSSFIAFYFQGFSFISICQKIFESDYPTLFRAIDATGDQRASGLISQFRNQQENNVGGCFAESKKAIEFFCMNRSVANSMIESLDEGAIMFSVMDIEETNIFFKIPEHKLTLYSPLVSIIVSQMMNYLSQRPSSCNRTLFLLLDEFASYRRMEIAVALQRLRKRHVRIMLLVQTTTSIEKVYGEAEFRDMFNNMAYKVILGVSEPETQKYLADLIGEVDKVQKSQTSSGAILGRTTSTTTSSKREHAVYPSELGYLSEKKELIVIKPDGWMRLKKNFWFE